MATPLKRALIVLSVFILLIPSCKLFEKGTVPFPTGTVPGLNDSTSRWLDWVGAFKGGLDSVTRANYLDKVRQQLLLVRSDYTVPPGDSTNYPYTYFLSRHIRDSFPGPFQMKNIHFDFCNCENDQVFAISADLLYGTDTTGESTPVGVKPKPGTVVSGDEVVALSRNEEMSNPSESGGVLDMAGLVTFPASSQSHAVLAIIDTGLDTMLLDEQLRRTVLWHGPGGGQNLLPGANRNNYIDDHTIRHGTAVATIAMRAFNNETRRTELPQLMILKAADSQGHGTLLAYACALSFAIENNANIINSSMGFYGGQTPMIDYLMRRAKQQNIPIVAAAGNADSSHVLPLCRDNINTANELVSPSRMFYPAVLANDQEHYMIMSVTGESEAGMPCYFQNYSQEYVTLGVVNRPANGSCCFFLLPFIGQGRGLEGSSFATPVASGRLAAKVLQGGPPSTIRNCVDRLGNVTSRNGTPVTQNNQFFEYEP